MVPKQSPGELHDGIARTFGPKSWIRTKRTKKQTVLYLGCCSCLVIVFYCYCVAWIIILFGSDFWVHDENREHPATANTRQMPTGPATSPPRPTCDLPATDLRSLSDHKRPANTATHPRPTHQPLAAHPRPVVNTERSRTPLL